MEEITQQSIQLYAQYIEGLKRLSGKERDAISKVLVTYKRNKEKTYDKKSV